MEISAIRGGGVDAEWQMPLKISILFFYRTQVRSLFTLVTDSVTHWRLVNLIDVTRTYEDGNSKLVEIVTVFDVDDEKGVCNSLLQI